MKRLKTILVIVTIILVNTSFVILLKSDNIFYKKKGVKKKSGLINKIEKDMKNKLNVTITEPSEDETVKMSFAISGTAGKNVEYVEVKIDNCKWLKATGVDSWSITFTEISLGEHKIYARGTSKYNLDLTVSTKINVCEFIFGNYMIPEMVSIPAVTSFSMGGPVAEGGTADERPIHAVNLNAFYISKYETTIQQYVYFLNSGEQDSHYHTEMANIIYCGIIMHGNGNYSAASGRKNYPVVYISWYDVVAYCNWLSASTPNTYRLPTEAEWEYAAVGTNGHITYSWGNTFYSNYCNWSDNGGDGSKDGFVYTAPIGSYENGKSLLGLYDMTVMSGNGVKTGIKAIITAAVQ